MANLRGSCLGLEFAGSAWSFSVSLVSRQTKVALRALFRLAWLHSSPFLTVEGGWSRRGRPRPGTAGRPGMARHPWQAFAAHALANGRGPSTPALAGTARRAHPVALRALFWLAEWRSSPFLATRGLVPPGHRRLSPPGRNRGPIRGSPGQCAILAISLAVKLFFCRPVVD